MKLLFCADWTSESSAFTRFNVRLDDVVGMTCRSLLPLTNGSFSAPSGTLFKIDGVKPGLKLTIADPCKHCGIKGRITRINYTDVVIIGVPPARR